MNSSDLHMLSRDEDDIRIVHHRGPAGILLRGHLHVNRLVLAQKVRDHQERESMKEKEKA
jgi:hypothetical protein